ncbi:probable G-protein coupled receptor 148 [Thalassophryne amazonica]|uniref:probable G-protein coupled receptor 148 n=1 Tax=Thalassophryne amazonica TaxID=390379 RepID=UPI0014714ACF|nr:probable G-protein coupled receptor 148 [Thalassophryne amazonica]
MTSSNGIANLTKEWLHTLRHWKLELFYIPTTAIALATLVANPILLTCIFTSRTLRQETRYLLVANTLIADTLFLIVHLVTVFTNLSGAGMPWLVCELVTAVTITTYSSAILTVTLMVVDTYAAVRWPLHYRDRLPPSRTHCILVGVWLVAAVYPFSLVTLMEVETDSHHEKVQLCLVLISLGFIQAQNMLAVYIYFFVAAIICALLIFYCYIRLYMVTKTQGIWQNRFSRARVTLLIHGVLLLLYFTPGFIFAVELHLFQKPQISHDVRVWVSTVNMCIFMLLPQVFAPFLYGLRFREISDTVRQLLHRHRTFGNNT